jgi:hypothetical protein
MTREEAIICIKGIKNLGHDMFTEQKDFQECLDMAIKALEQEPILDKIRAEIWDLQYGDEEKSMTDEDRADAYNNAIRQVIEIIDKYKAESGEVEKNVKRRSNRHHQK